MATVHAPIQLPMTITAFLRSPSGPASVVVMLVVAAVAVVGPSIWGEPASKLNVDIAGSGPSAGHLLGTDSLGRDILLRTLVASRLSLTLACLAAGLSAAIGLPLGAGIALSSPRMATVLSRINDGLLSFPDILVAILLLGVFGGGSTVAAIAIGIAGVPWFVRVASTLAASVVGRDFVAAARIVGISNSRILLRYILPNIAETTVVTVFVALGYTLIAVSSLSFLGLGAQPPEYDWGLMLNQGVQVFYEAPLAALAPALAIVFSGLLFGLFGDALARSLNPRLWTAAKSTPRLGLLSAQSVGIASDAFSETAGLRQKERALLRVHNLSITFPGRRAATRPVRNVSFEMNDGEILGLVGESGSGKTLTTLAIGGLVPHPGRVTADRIELCGIETAHANGQQRRRLPHVAFIFQDPMSSLNPALKVGTQLMEGPRVRELPGPRRAHAIASLMEVQVSAPEARLGQYPHELSGGMRQRVMIAMGLLARPVLIVADEPTTALDVTVQAQVLDVLREVNVRHGTGVILVSHNLAVVAEICTRVLVMYAGRVVEDSTIEALLLRPAHPYTRALVGAIPSFDPARRRQLRGIDGRPPDPDDLPAGCPYAPRCPLRVARCEEEPGLLPAGPGSKAACWVTTIGNPSETT